MYEHLKDTIQKLHPFHTHLWSSLDNTQAKDLPTELFW